METMRRISREVHDGIPLAHQLGEGAIQILLHAIVVL